MRDGALLASYPGATVAVEVSVQDVITAADRAEAESMGLITVDEYESVVEHGELG